MTMKISKLVAELQAGGMSVDINLQGEDGGHLIQRLIERLGDTLAQRRRGTEFEGRIRQTAGESSASAHFPENWKAEDAQILMQQLSRLCEVLNVEMPFEASAEVVDEGAESQVIETSKSAQEPDELPYDPLPEIYRADWIGQLRESQSHLGKLLEEHGIESDEQYVRLEEKFSDKHRIDLAAYRFGHGLRQAENEDAPGGIDLQILALFVPPWIKRVPMAISGFPKRGRNCFRSSRINDIADLARISMQTMLQIPNLGRLTYKQIAQAFQAGLMEYAAARLLEPKLVTDPPPKNHADFSSFSSVWAEVLRLIDDNGKGKREILTRRIGVGLVGGPETLEKVGESRDVCRERIRQLQKETIDRLRENPGFRNIRASLESEIERQVKWSGGPIRLGDDCPLHALKGASNQTVKVFFQLVLGSKYKVLISTEPDGKESARIIYGMSEDELRGALEQVETFITEHESRPRSEFMPLIEDYIRQGFHESIHSDLKSFVDEWINWDHSSDPHIISFGDSIEAATAAVLERANRPLKLDELVEIAANDFGLVQKESSIRNALHNLCLHPGKRSRQNVAVSVFQIGRSEFCTARHLPFDLNELSHLVPTLREIILTGRRCIIPDQPYQWHADCLWEELKKRLPDSELSNLRGGDRWRAVDALLRYHAPEGVVNLKKGRWVRDIPGVDQKARTLQEATIYLLQNHFPNQRVPAKQLLEKLEQLQSIGARGKLKNKPPVRCEGGECWLDG